MYANYQKRSPVNKGNAGHAPVHNASVLPLSSGIPNSAMLTLLDYGDTRLDAYSPNKTGLPDALKARFERLTGMPLDDVRVHRNSDKPADLGALAYARGNEIHLGPGQEEHLEHELGHVIQQKQGLVEPTGKIDGDMINDESFLEEMASSDPQNRYGKDPDIYEDNIIQFVNTKDKPLQTSLTEEAIKIRESEKSKDLPFGYYSEAIFSEGKLFSRISPDKAKIVDCKVIFVLGTDNILYVHEEPHGIPRQDEFTHANFLQGAPVKTAGQMFVRKGIITRIDNESGHYKPKDVTLEWLLDYLVDKIDLSTVILSMMTSSGIIAYNAQSYYKEDSLSDVTKIDDERIRQEDTYQSLYDSTDPCHVVFNNQNGCLNLKLLSNVLSKQRKCKIRFIFQAETADTSKETEILNKIFTGLPLCFEEQKRKEQKTTNSKILVTYFLRL